VVGIAHPTTYLIKGAITVEWAVPTSYFIKEVLSSNSDESFASSLRIVENRGLVFLV